MAWLCVARLAIALLPFGWWRGWIGPGKTTSINADQTSARQIAAHVERAAWRLPFQTKCLPQSMALSWMLARRGIDHQLTIAVRPQHLRTDEDRLHAWLAVNGRIVLGDLPGPWLVMFEAG
jgi:hypothetical protein